MAQMKEISLDEIQAVGREVKVGHNRTIEYMGGNVFSCRLHGSEIAQFELESDPRAIKVSLDHCRYMTTTTRQAMKDFMGFFGVQGGVSFAKGKFGIRYRAVDTRYYDIDDAPRNVTFVAAR